MSDRPNESSARRPGLGFGLIVRRHWEVFAAVLVLLGVLTIIDVGAIGEGDLLASLTPLACVSAAALGAWSLRGVASWVAGIVALATLSGEIRYLGLAYPAVGLGVLLVLQKYWGAPVNPAMILFRAGAFLALLLLVRHVWRTEAPRIAIVLVTYLVAIATVRECVVRALTRAINVPLPYVPNQGLGQVGFVNVVVVAGWVFTALLSFELAKMIQRASFPGTNIFLTLALSALVTTTISYAVEVTGMGIHLWTWTAPTPVTWLPFDWPFDAFEGWAATSFMMLFVYAAVRWRLFSPTAWKSATATFVLLMLYGLSDLAQPWLGPESPRKKLTLLYVLLSVALGFRAPASLLGSSAAALEDVGAPYPEGKRAA